nr:histidine kinase-like ATPase, C-terminal domain-containing protein [Tanacetum cinerariifolium]
MSFVLEEINKEGPANTNSTKCDVDVKTDVEPSELDVLVASKHVSKGCADNISSHPRKQSVFLRKIYKLESSLTQHWSADDFASLEFRDIFTFLGKHISLLPTTWQDYLTCTDKVAKPSVKVCMSQSYLLEFLSKIANSLGEHEILSNLMLSQLLKMQFPSAGLTLLEDDFTADLLTNLSKNDDHVSSSIMLFSLTLSDFRAEKGFSDMHVGTNDAIELLLKAPMLVDLSLWSCWDYKFAPLFVGWLLSNVTTKELLYLVAKDGTVLRLDHSATVDSFLEYFLHGSSFETAVKRISLIFLYGGKRNVPLSLLKFHANFDFEGVPIVTRFVLDCLGYTPKEFQRFGVEFRLLMINVYPRHVEPTLTFILQEKSIIVLNNEHGFSAENIKALCDVGNSTKKKASSGYIGKRGTGFK